MNLTLPAELVKGDSFSIEATLDRDMTNWKVRCEIYDEAGLYIQLATANSGGSDDDIEITDEANGVFLINVAKDTTTNFKDKAFIEIEVETNDSPTKQYTIYQGEIDFKDEKIDWKEPS